MVKNKKIDLTKMELPQIMAAVRDNKISLFDIIGSATPGDYWSHVQIFRFAAIMMRDLDALKAMLSDLNRRIEQIREETSSPSNEDWIEKTLVYKDGHRRFSKLEQHCIQTFDSRKSLLTGTDFESCLKQYKTLISHVEDLWESACQAYRSKKYPICTFISILVIEEIGKLSSLYKDLILYDVPKRDITALGVDRDHRRKHFISVISGALINARLDRVLGKNIVRKFLHEAESDELEKTRQSCLYIDRKDGQPVTPGQIIPEKRAKELVVLSGELMAEVLGHFPWEFQRMIKNVITFEREIGMPEKKIARC